MLPTFSIGSKRDFQAANMPLAAVNFEPCFSLVSLLTNQADIKETVGGIPEREEIINWNINISAPVPKIELPNFEKISPGLGADFGTFCCFLTHP